LSFLGPALDLIGKNATVLPASGGAFEDMARPDIEEADDRFFGSESDAKQGFRDFAETPTPNLRELYRPTPAIFRADEHVFRYFCDGSIKTYFLGTIIEGNRSYPLELTQIGAAIVHRKDDGRLEVARLEQFGHRLLAHFHSHPGIGIEATRPSGTDAGFQKRLEDAGYPAVAAIFSRDGYIRFFRLDDDLEVEIYGSGVEQHGKNSFRITDAS
jgi:hypothetical protein